MRLRSTAKLFRDGQPRRTGGSLHTPRAVRAPDLITIPRIDPAVLGQFSKASDTSIWAQAALLWMENGGITEADTGSAVQLVNNAVSTWVNHQTGELRHLDFSVHITTNDPCEGNGIEEGDAWEGEGLFLQYYAGACNTFTLQSKLEGLYTVNPALAETAMYWLELAGARTLNLLTPWRGRDVATYTWWYGQDDQEAFLEEYGLYSEDDDELEGAEDGMEGVVGPDQWDEAFPKWVRQPEAKLTQDELMALAGCSESSLATQVAALVASIAENGDVMLPGVERTDMESVYFGAHLRWNEQDPLLRLLDDWINNANQCGDGYTELYGLDFMPFNPEKFSEWQASMSKVFSQIQKIDRLIDLIAVPTEERS